MKVRNWKQRLKKTWRGWGMSFKKVELGEFIKVQGGYAYKSDDFNDDGDFPVIKIKNVRFGNVDYEEASYINAELADETIDWKTKEGEDRKSTRLNSSHVAISYAVFCLNKNIK